MGSSGVGVLLDRRTAGAWSACESALRRSAAGRHAYARRVSSRPLELASDCARCAGLCCVAHAFQRSSDFAFDKPAGTPCRNLQADFRCVVHADLRTRGFPGCTVYECFGAGQRVTQQLFGGRTWRDEPAIAGEMFAAFTAMRGLHELLWYLTQALAVPAAAALHEEVARVRAEVSEAADGPDLQPRVGELLGRVSALARHGLPARRARGADLTGATLARADLRGADLRGALLIGADLRDADLRLADLLGADLRGARLAGADLTDALFLTPPQVASAQGAATTRLPTGMAPPAHW
ncbi:pentapeptide repeat-containing protein [Cellulomonas sp. zg-ZUI188]|uniref:Pentapeptide repeat-containing protein n=1 Tax=Cellulomonas fengjieae TaxID=2819978 RepID=A0ABS3SFU1_9CELL|nr:pentapeptide repeat-containing protein [Cellulomonas fengjieae]QVI67814.1 pentapeptide repeat-containing protein [Cellulomonas fengjieae]